MKSPEQIGKIEAVVLYILQQFQEGLDYIKLFKIMYFAQREYLALNGLCIVEDTFRARLNGPVPSLTYKVMKFELNRFYDKLNPVFCMLLCNSGLRCVLLQKFNHFKGL